MRTRSHSVHLSHCLRGLLSSVGSIVIAALPLSGRAETNSKATSVTLKDWTAAGSGCRSQMNKPGDVELVDVRTQKSSGSELLILKFNLPKYRLISPPDNPKTSITFARECALRIAAQPQNKVQIKSIAARAPISYSKEADVGLKMQYLLRLDGEIVGQSLKEVEPGQAIRGADDIIILKGKPSEETEQIAKVNPQNCSSAHMLGFDYTFIAARKNLKDSALVQPGEEKQLEIAIEMEPCR